MGRGGGCGKWGAGRSGGSPRAGRWGGWPRAGSGDPDAGRDLGRRAFPEEHLLPETCIPIPTVRVQDPERGSSAGRTGPVACDHDIGGLPDDISAEPDPRSAGELQADPRPLPDRGGHRAHEPRRFEDQQGDSGSPGESGEPTESISEPRRPVGTRGQVQNEKVHGPA